ncbi:protein of unknown function [Methylorubrum extorquens DM4]|uniref:Uncharacterized protein n=1 Tax=Methylorubrum extorquens (strain DSM 6343 / CIP 106787 / DM4) TaxID=661410 RepID=C7CH72_METED|nr:protein of unknown function [Methylorubrum extorquens DM4]
MLTSPDRQAAKGSPHVTKVLLVMLPVFAVLAFSALLRLPLMPFRLLRAFWRDRTAPA